MRAPVSSQTRSRSSIASSSAAAGREALSDGVWARDISARLRTAGTRLDKTLVAGGLEIIGGTDLFRLARHEQAGCIFDRLIRQGILVRPFENTRLLRFGLPASDEQFDRLASALKPGWNRST